MKRNTKNEFKYRNNWSVTSDLKQLKYEFPLYLPNIML